MPEKNVSAQMIVYKTRDNRDRSTTRHAILIPNIRNAHSGASESVLVVKYLGKIHFVHIIGEKLGTEGEIGYYCVPSSLPLPRTKKDYTITQHITIDREVAESALAAAENATRFISLKRKFSDML